MKKMNKMKRRSKYLSLLLRHDPERAGLDIDREGWVGMEQVIDALGCTDDELDSIVYNDRKGRFVYNEHKTLIRAAQGHSILVDINFNKVIPPELLYHGTCIDNIESIMKNGIKSMSRLYVHISPDIETAFNVGKRHGVPAVIIINALNMHNDNIDIYESKNGVFLTKFIPHEYIKDVLYE